MNTTVARELANKVLENKMNKIAERRGFRIEKAPRSDEDARDLGGYILAETLTNAVVLGSGPSATLDEIEIFLRSAKLPERKNPRKAKKWFFTGMMEKR